MILARSLHGTTKNPVIIADFITLLTLTLTSPNWSQGPLIQLKNHCLIQHSNRELRHFPINLASRHSENHQKSNNGIQNRRH